MAASGVCWVIPRKNTHQSTNNLKQKHAWRVTTRTTSHAHEDIKVHEDTLEVTQQNQHSIPEICPKFMGFSCSKTPVRGPYQFLRCLIHPPEASTWPKHLHLAPGLPLPSHTVARSTAFLGMAKTCKNFPHLLKGEHKQKRKTCLRIHPWSLRLPLKMGLPKKKGGPPIVIFQGRAAKLYGQ